MEVDWLAGDYRRAGVYGGMAEIKSKVKRSKAKTSYSRVFLNFEICPPLASLAFGGSFET